MSDRLRTAVLFGGKSSEYEVSLRSAMFVLTSLDPEKYEVLPIGITRENIWKLYGGPLDRIPSDEWDSPALPEVVLRPGCPKEPLAALRSGKLEPLAVDVVFPVLHGKNGEDGTVQGAFQLCGTPIVGCECDASAACMNKVYTHEVLAAEGIPSAEYLCVRADEASDLDAIERRAREKLGYPIFVKPARAGSSVGVTKAHDAGQLREGLRAALREDSIVLLERTLHGMEVECAVMGNGRPFATEPAEIVSAAEFYDYAAKYDDIGSEVIIPARLSPEMTEKVRNTARRAYRALFCRGLSRVDMFAAEDGTVYVNEINTLPGFTAISGYPLMMANMGIKGPALCDRLIGLALGREAE